MNDGKVDWRGNFVAIATPFEKNGAIDEGKFVKNVELLRSEGANGFVVCGCTGEAWAMSAPERLRAFKLTRQTVGKDFPVVGGTATATTQDTLELSKAAIKAGCDGVLLMPPYYSVIKERELRHHFKTISDGLGAPIFLYNMPKRTGINMPPALLADLAQLEWIVALKQSSGDFTELEATLAACGDSLNLFAGHSAERGFAAVSLGCPGFVSSMEAQIMGREAISMYDLAIAGTVEEGRRIQQRTIALDKAMREVGTFPANMKTAMNLLGRPGGYCRAPLLDLDKAETDKVRKILEGLQLLEPAHA